MAMCSTRTDTWSSSTVTASPCRRPWSSAANALVGSFCTVLPGVTLGEGCLVAAGSVVTKDVPPHSLAGGNPARVLSEDVEWSD